MEHDYLVVATKEELNLPEAQKANLPVIITGVGGTNVIRALRNLPKGTRILNVGYCGSTSFTPGSVVEVSYSRLFHPNCEFKEEEFRVGNGEGNTLCLTAGDFVIGGTIPENSVVDMELAYICALGFEVRSVKYVSDMLDYDEYEHNSGNK